MHELQMAAPCLTVLPHQRVKTMHCLQERGYSGTESMQAEGVAMVHAAGKLKLYISFVQELLHFPAKTIEEVEAHCRKGDVAQAQLSTINIRRDTLLKRLRAFKFECPEVPETKESSRKCPVCKCDDLKVTARQTRSADEGQTIFYVCNNPKCGKEFR